MLSLRIESDINVKANTKKNDEGWKLLLTVHPDQLEVAQQCVLPILNFYGCFHTWLTPARSQQPMTLISLKRVGLEISQFTQPEVYVTPYDLKVMLRQITEALTNHQVLPGEVNSSNVAKTFSPYFFLTNTNFNYLWLSFTVEYKKLLEKEGGFNPLNTPNPYEAILLEPANYDLLKSFSQLPYANSQDVLNNLRVSLLGFLRQYTHIDDFSLQDKETFTRECLKLHTVLDEKFIKSEEKANIQDIKTAKILFEWTFSECAHEIIVDPLTLPISDLFGELINRYNQGIKFFPDSPYTTVAVDDFLQSKRKNLIEHWLLDETELVKENDKVILEKIKEKLPQLIHKNDCYDLHFAIKKLKKVVAIPAFHQALSEYEKHPIVKIELADLLINDYSELHYDKPVAYKAIKLLKEAISLDNLDEDMECAIVKKVEKLWQGLAQYESRERFLVLGLRGTDLLIKALKELLRDECRLAKFIMARFLCRDLGVDEDSALNGVKRKYINLDHKEAEGYFLEILAHPKTSPTIKQLSQHYLSTLTQYEDNKNLTI